MSTDLQWLLIRKWNAFQVKGTGHPTFSRESGNVPHLHQKLYSGLLHPVTVKPIKGGYEISHRKPDASVHDVAKGRETRNYKKNAGIHGAVKHAVGAANASERPELTRLAATKVYALAGSQRAPKKRRSRQPKQDSPAAEAE